MRPRLTIVAMLLVGMLMSGAGTGLAFQGFGQSGYDASKAQYKGDGSGPTDVPDRPAVPAAPTGPPDRPGVVDFDHDVLGDADDLQVARQVEVGSQGSTLPFTGFAAILVLVLGAALVAAGLGLRRQAPRGD